MSGFSPPIGYPFNAPGYGVATVQFVNAAGFPATFTAKPSDWMILVDLASYGGAGPTITLAPPVEDFPVMVRNVTGSGATHNLTVTAPTGCTVEDPANPGSFVASVVLSTVLAVGIWSFDRARVRFVLSPPSSTAAAALTVFGADLIGSTSTLQWIASISGQGGAGGNVPGHFNTLTFDAAQVTPTIVQAAVTADVATTPMRLGAQSSRGANVTNVNGAPIFLTGGAAANNGVTGVRGSAILSIGEDFSSNCLVEALEVAPGRRFAVIGNVGSSQSGNGGGAGFPTGDGVTVIGIAQTAPTSASGNGMAYVWSGAFVGLAPFGFHGYSGGAVGVDSLYRTLVPGTGDTINSQALRQPEALRLARITSNGTLAQTVGTASGKSGRLEITVVGRTVTAGAAGAVGDSYSFSAKALYRNVGGTVTIIGSSVAIEFNDASHAGTTVTVTASTSFYTVTLTGATNAGAVVDVEMLVRELRD